VKAPGGGETQCCVAKHDEERHGCCGPDGLERRGWGIGVPGSGGQNPASSRLDLVFVAGERACLVKGHASCESRGEKPTAHWAKCVVCGRMGHVQGGVVGAAAHEEEGEPVHEGEHAVGGVQTGGYEEVQAELGGAAYGHNLENPDKSSLGPHRTSGDVGYDSGSGNGCLPPVVEVVGAVGAVVMAAVGAVADVAGAAAADVRLEGYRPWSWSRHHLYVDDGRHDGS
jgi:hypothetical protein